MLAAGELDDLELQQVLHVAADDRGVYGGSPELARLDPRVDMCDHAIHRVKPWLYTIISTIYLPM